MKISVLGKSKRKNDPKHIHKAIEFYAKRLLGKKLSKKISIDVILIPNLTMGNDILYGFCDPLSYANKPRKFLIALSSTETLKTLIRVLAHEMVHVKQYAEGKLRPYNHSLNLAYRQKFAKGKVKKYELPETYMWKGKLVTVPYRQQPWEVEARAIEHELYKEYIAT